MTVKPFRTKKITKVAAIQMCSTHLLDENLKTAESFILEASRNNAKLIVLPEMFGIFGKKSIDINLKMEVFGAGKIQDFLSNQAKKNKVWIVGGTIPLMSQDKNKINASCLIFDDLGNCISRYDKIHLFDVNLSSKEKYNESETAEPGDKIIVANTPFGKIGLAVCYDLRFPELFRCLFNLGAEIICVPSAFTFTTGKAHWEILSRSRAIENFCYFVGACQGGVHTNGRKTYGHSMIIDPWGKIISKIKNMVPGIIYANVNLEKVRESRAAIPIKNHQRILIDSSSLIKHT